MAIDGSNNTANVGNLLRTAHALEVDAVLLSASCCDPWYRRAVRVSMGHCFHIPTIKCESLADTLLLLQEEDRVQCYSAVITDDAADIAAVAGPSSVRSSIPRWCCVLGSEHAGVSPEVLSVTTNVRIPMRPGVDSLSITAAASIVLAYLRRGDGESGTTSGDGRLKDRKNTCAGSSSDSERNGGVFHMLMLGLAGFAVGVAVGQRTRVSR